VQFLDDVSMFVFNRDFNKDILTNKQELEEILKENNSKKTLKDINIKKRTKEEIIEELKKEKYERELKIRLQRLDRFYKI
jgi:glycerol dehydrogenase-like iron-containing ADH family enzyme